MNADWKSITKYLLSVSGLTQAALAAVIGVHENTVYLIAKGKTLDPSRQVRSALWNILTFQVGHDKAQGYLL